MKRILTALVLATLLVLTLASSAMATDAAPETFEIVSCERVSAGDIVITFNQPIDANGLSNPFTALRWYSMDGEQAVTLVWDGDTPLQTQPLNTQISDDGMSATIMFDETILNTYLDPESQWLAAGHRPFLAIEEVQPPSGHDHAFLTGVMSATGVELSSNCPGPGGNWDAVCLTIDQSKYDPENETEETFAPEATRPQETTAAPTDAPTEAPDDTDAPETDAPAKSGCGAALVSAPVIALAALAGVVLTKKKH